MAGKLQVKSVLSTKTNATIKLQNIASATNSSFTSHLISRLVTQITYQCI